MWLLPRTPAVYRFNVPVGTRSTLPRWSSWSWSKAKELADIIYESYGFEWDQFELLNRFGYGKGLIGEHPFSAGLKILEPRLELLPYWYDYRTFHPGMISVLKQRLAAPASLLVPAPWAKEVLWSLENQCRRMCVIDRVAWACEENGTPRFAWPAAG